MKKQILSLILCCCGMLYAETHITGDISGMPFEISGNPYIVEQDILIPDGKRVVIKEGCVFLFKPFTGLTVQGHLLVEGSSEKPVIFTSINDGEFNAQSEQLANPFDWNGVLVARESGTVALNNFSLRFSVYGIKSQNPNIQIKNGSFKQNGQFHFTINDKIQFVQDNLPYSFNASDAPPAKPKDEPVKKPKITDDKPEKSGNPKAKLAIRFGSLGIGVAGAVTGIILGAQVPSAHKEWTQTTSDDNRWNEYESAKKNYEQKLIGAIIGGSVGILGLAGFGVTFIF